MIPVELRIKGMYSYRDEQVIDFTRLTDSGLFGIFGPVGSGKSTILEAVTYALYGQIERMNNRDSVNENMMNLSSRELGVEFTFKVANGTDKLFKSVFSAKRKKDGRANLIKQSYYRLESGEPVPIEKKELEDALGIEYKDFRQTVIIPQGQFREFLELGAKARTEMLQRLFDLDEYDLEDKLKYVKGKAKSEYEIMKNDMGKLEAFTPELARGKSEELAGARAASESAGKELEAARAIVEKYNAVESIFTKLTKVQSRLAGLEPDRGRMEWRKEQLARHRECMINFKSPADAITALSGKISGQESALKQRAAELEREKAELAGREENLAAARGEKEKIPEKMALASDLKIMAELRESEQLLEACNRRLENYNIEADKLAAETGKASGSLAAVEEEYSQLATMIESLGGAAEAREWFGKRMIYKSNVARLTDDYVKAKRGYDEAQFNLNEYAAGGLNRLAGTSAGDSPAEIKKKIENALLEAGNERRAAQERQLEIARRARISEFAGMLAEGEPCPLCGSLSHPHPAAAEEIGRDNELLNERIAKADASERNIKIAEKRYLELEAGFGKAMHAFEAAGKALDAAEAELEQYCSGFNSNRYSIDDEERATADALKLSDASGRRNRLDSRLAAARADLEKLRVKKEKYDAEAKKIESEKTALESTSAAKRSMMKSSAEPEFFGQSAAGLRSMSEEITREAERIDALFNKLEVQVRELSEKKSKTAGAVQSLESELESNRRQLEERRVEFAEAASAQGYSVEEAFRVLGMKIDVGREDREISEYFTRLQELETESRSLAEQLEGSSYDAAGHSEARLRLASAESGSREAISRIARVEAEISSINARIAEKEALSKEFAALSARMENIDALSSLFYAKGFVEYASAGYLKNLCNIANRRFKRLTNRSMAIELSSSNDFVVRDMLNGGKTRSIKTLSGGQMFQAALCLALALSESISVFKNNRHNFFFLDEGFGTLDKDSLHIVFDTLKSLREENRIVGVISHVEEMKEEIERYISVRNDPTVGSVVTTAWE